jgi:holo-[acyl-carrier protein] synthase
VESLTGPTVIEPLPPLGLETVGGVIGVGIDVVDIERMAWTLQRTPRFRTRVFTEGERAICDDKAEPAASYAGRFAVKESVLKVLGEGIFDIRLTNIEVCGGVDEAPTIAVHGRAAELAAVAGVHRWLVSISHDAGVAAAIVIGAT